MWLPWTKMFFQTYVSPISSFVTACWRVTPAFCKKWPCALNSTLFRSLARLLIWRLVCRLACWLRQQKVFLTSPCKSPLLLTIIFIWGWFTTLTLLLKEPCNAFLANILKAWGLFFMPCRQKNKNNYQGCVRKDYAILIKTQMKQLHQLKSETCCVFWDKWEGRISWWHSYHGAHTAGIHCINWLLETWKNFLSWKLCCWEFASKCKFPATKPPGQPIFPCAV